MITIRVQGPTRDELGIVDEAELDWRNTGFERVAKASRILEQAVKRKYSLLRGTVSLPGQPPAMQSGDLYRSVNRSQPRRIRDGILSIVGATMFYARWVEYGGRTQAGTGRIRKVGWKGAYRPPRPAWRPAVLEQYGAMLDALEGK
jgi:hypothetical protein